VRCELRYSINVTLDGCHDHRAIPSDEDVHRQSEDRPPVDRLEAEHRIDRQTMLRFSVRGSTYDGTNRPESAESAA